MATDTATEEAAEAVAFVKLMLLGPDKQEQLYYNSLGKAAEFGYDKRLEEYNKREMKRLQEFADKLFGGKYANTKVRF